MEKINNYTPRNNNEVRLLDFVLTPSGKLGQVVALGEFVGTVRIKMDGDYEDFSPSKLRVIDLSIAHLAPTLYEQHFKMLQALKALNEERGFLGERFTKQFLEDLQQIIKDCEL